ncbi:MAG: hypothetical protein KF784_07330 [Fimbriimonadaceae bacterium]|nr:hypothetical protein [Fimbriimonadaceae bacterium]
MEDNKLKRKRNDAACVWRAGAITAAAVGLILGLVAFAIGGINLEYSLYFFALLPLLVGMIASGVLSIWGYFGFDKHLGAGLVACVLLSFGLLVFSFEGAICLLMAAPLILISMFVGSAIGCAIYNYIDDFKRQRMNVAVLILALPFVSVLNQQLAPPPQKNTTSTAIIIDAPANKIWPYLNNLPDIPAPNELLFRAGVAHPVSTRTLGSGVGAERHCELSTGDMPEVITRYEPNKLLEFKVLKTPPSMIEMNPFGEVHAAHLEGFYECRIGRFELIPLADGRTKVVGTSVYEHRFGPRWYWTLWTDKIVHDVHLRVLREVKKRAEAEG